MTRLKALPASLVSSKPRTKPRTILSPSDVSTTARPLSLQTRQPQVSSKKIVRSDDEDVEMVDIESREIEEVSIFLGV